MVVGGSCDQRRIWSAEVPILSDEGLDKAIAAEEIGAITLDTNILEKFGFTLITQ